MDKKNDRKKKKKKNKKKLIESSIHVKDHDDENSFPSRPIGSDEEEDGPTVVVPDLGGRDNLMNDRQHDARRERFYDSDSSRGESRRGKRKRYDSDDESVSDHRQRSKSQNDTNTQRIEYRNTEKDSVDKVAPRKRYDSDDDDEEESLNARSNADYTLNERRGSPSNSKSRYGRFDSDDDVEANGVSINSIDRGQQSKVRKMTSGHNAGLQTSADFRKVEELIQKNKAGKLKDLERGETVYRNKDGQFISVDHAKDGKSLKVSSPTWNLGTAQKQQMMDRLREEESVTLGAFSRSISDVDHHQRDIIRQGDPMARQETSNASKKLYKGPPPKPNRFGIRPGYRWDGVDRGNGFEDQVLATLYAKGRKKEESYKWSCADM